MDRKRNGFTLVEMLVVVVIIGILAGMIGGAAIMVRNRARVAALAAEIGKIEMSLNDYKEAVGEYPPDGSDIAAVKAHLTKLAPRAVNLSLPAAIDPSTALCFWLGGMHDGTDFIGFSPDPRNPFEVVTRTGRIGPFYEFDKRRLDKVSNYLFRYRPNNNNVYSHPIVYFRARLYNQYAGQWAGTSSPENYSYTVRPFLDTTTAGGFVNPKTFQILTPGLDGKYMNASQPAPGTRYPDGADYTPAQYDDITSFSGGRTLEQNIP